jgi:virulence-associated protein VapD
MAENFDLEKYLAEEETTSTQDLDLKSYLEEEAQMETSTDPEEMSKLEAFVETATAMGGLRPLLTGAVSAGMKGLQDLIGDPTTRALEELPADPTGKKFEIIEKEDMLDAFRSMRAKEAAKIRQASEDQPAAAFGGSILDAIALGKLGSAITGTGKLAQATKAILPSAEKLEKATLAQKTLALGKEGAKAGALAELGTGEGEGLVETAKDVLGGATIGVATGVSMPIAKSAVKSVGKGIKGIGKGVSDIFEGTALARKFSLGRQFEEAGINVDTEEIRNSLNKLATQSFDDIRQEFAKHGIKKQEALQLATERGIKLDFTDFIEKEILDTMDVIKHPRTMESTKKDFKKYLTQLKDVKTTLARVSEDVYSEDSLFANPVEAQNTLNQLKDFAGNLKDVKGSHKLQTMVKRLSGEIRNRITDTLEEAELGQANKALRRLFGARELAKIDTNAKEEISRMTNIGQLQKFLTARGESSGINQKNFFDVLRKVNPELAKDEKQIYLLQEALTESKDTSIGFLDPRTIARKIGEKTVKIEKKIEPLTQNISNMYSRLSKVGPEGLDKLADRAILDPKMVPYHNVLTKLKESPQNTKNALLWSLIQQPAFRELVRSEEEGDKDE